MGMRLRCLTVIALALATAGAVESAVFTDTFEAVHDYMADGVEGTFWDGFVGLGPDETVDALNASVDRPGQLYIQSTEGRYQEPWIPLAPFLYKVIEGDFIATVQVTEYAGTEAAPVYHNNCGILVRAVPDEAGAGEDWVALDYFPIWSCGNFVRSADDDVRTEDGHNGRQFNLDPYLQIERIGNAFHFRTSADGASWTEMAVSPLTRDDFDGLALQVGLFQATYNTEQGHAAFDNFSIEGPLVVPGLKAYNPNPANEVTDIPREAELAWSSADAAATYNVYFGDSLDDVTAADENNPLGVLVSQGQSDLAYDPDGLFEFGQTYYWRVDLITAEGEMYPGNVWSFTAEPLAYPIANITATSNGTSEPDLGPERTVDGSGLNAEDQHSTAEGDMWAGTTGGTEPVWIQYDFDQVYKLHELQVWNYNVLFELMLGFGFRDVTIETSENGADWTVLTDVQFAQGTARADYTASTTVDLEGIAAQSVRLTANSGYGMMGQYGLSEVRFLYTPVRAREPEPTDGAADVGIDTLLTWRAGREASAHEVHLGTAADALALADTVADSAYHPGVLSLDTTYYWQINEVNEAEATRSWHGPLWSFATQAFLVIDDFESYNDDDNRIYEAWIDGLDVPANGSQVGYFDAPFAEQTLVQSGRQSMPLQYDNTGGASYSEAELSLPAQDWTQSGITTLTLYFHGDPGNDAADVYVKINGTKVTGGGGTATAEWQQWDIDLAASGANLQNVTSIIVGAEGSGSGTIYVDDLRLY